MKMNAFMHTMVHWASKSALKSHSFPNQFVRPSRDSEHPRHLSAIAGNPLVGSTRVRGPTSGDSFNLLCLVLRTDFHNEIKFHIDQRREPLSRYLEQRYINIRLHYTHTSYRSFSAQQSIYSIEQYDPEHLEFSKHSEHRTKITSGHPIGDGYN